MTAEAVDRPFVHVTSDDRDQVVMRRDQFATLRVLRYWFGDTQVLTIDERRGRGGGWRASPSLASQQLLTVAQRSFATP